MKDKNQREEKREILIDIIEDNETVLFTTISLSGNIHSRPMNYQDVEFDGDLWFMTRKDTSKYDEILKNPKVNIGIFDDSYASIAGTAAIVEDDARKKEYWNKFYEKLFDTNYDDPMLVLIKVHVETAEYWETGNFTKSVVNFVKQVVGNEDHVKEEDDVNASVEL